MHLSSSLRLLKSHKSKTVEILNEVLVNASRDAALAQDVIRQNEDYIRRANLHLQSLSLSGPVSVRDVHEMKARQATVRRSIAFEQMSHDENTQRLNELEKTISQSQREKTGLLRKINKFEGRLKALEKANDLKLFNRNDEELEEQSVWKTLP